MNAVAQGDVPAYAALVERHLPAVYRHCQRLLDDAHEAEDIAQESFARLWQSAANWRPVGGGLPAWLHRVASNLCFDKLRRRREVTTDELPELVDDAPGADRLLQIGEIEGKLSLCLQRLPVRHRAALVLSYYEGYSNAVSAQILDMNIKAFESLLLRARRKMCEELNGEGVFGEDVVLLS